MARKATVRSITLTDETFYGLKAAAAIQGTSISKIVEGLAREYLKENSAMLKADLQKQMALFDFLDSGTDPQN